MLTRKQTELLLFINQRLIEDGVSPSFEEMKEALDLRSKSGIHRLITALEERGFIRRLPHRARALEVLRLPETAAFAGEKPAPIEAANDDVAAQASDRRPARQADSAGNERRESIVNLPLYGRIAAGTPIEALRDPSSTVEVPAAMLGRRSSFALEVAGDSMVEAGIIDGDTIIVEECDAADSGEIVVALIDGEEATLKRLRRSKGAVALEAANPAYETRVYSPDRVRIQGRLRGLLRRY